MTAIKSSPETESILRSLTTPAKIQDYLDSLPFNHEKDGETCRSAKDAIAHNRAHCLEGAFIACAALRLQQRPVKIVSIKTKPNDYDHIVTLFKENGYWGALSKTNHAVLGYRDPIYTTVRELLMTYFHEYYLVETGEKTMLGYTRPMSLLTFGETWISSNEDLFDIAYAIADAPYTSVIPKENKAKLRKATMLARKAASIPQESLL